MGAAHAPRADGAGRLGRVAGAAAHGERQGRSRALPRPRGGARARTLGRAAPRPAGGGARGDLRRGASHRSRPGGRARVVLRSGRPLAPRRGRRRAHPHRVRGRAADRGDLRGAHPGRARPPRAGVARCAGPVAAPPMERLGPRDRRPLSFAQERLWFLAELDPADTSYLVPLALRLAGPLDRGALGCGPSARSCGGTRCCARRSSPRRGAPWRGSRTTGSPSPSRRRASRPARRSRRGRADARPPGRRAVPWISREAPSAPPSSSWATPTTCCS